MSLVHCPRIRRLGLLALGPALLAVATACDAGPADARVVATEKARVQLETFSHGLVRPWGLAFLPDGRALVTEKAGRLRIVSRDGALSEPLEGVPAVDTTGQGGLLDIAVDPDFARNRTVYLSFAEARGEGRNGTSVARAKIGDGRVDDVRVIFRQEPALGGGHHFGSRIVIARDGTLFVTLGDRNIGRDRVQDPGTDLGKVVRIDRDGNAPADNPFRGQDGVRPELWSIGHRNVQGAALDPATGELWTNEHGPKGGEELNRTLAGGNYGWPLLTYGTEYSGAKISDRQEAPGFESPVHHWVPSIGTSGLAFYAGDAIPAWQGNVFVGALATKEVVRLELREGRVVHEERLFHEALGQRIRTIVSGPDGALYLLTDEDEGRIVRVGPAR
ncbi:MAG: PQQ-dependent sugar dehydrogenase [Steroidobacteraceae bacterium]